MVDYEGNRSVRLVDILNSKEGHESYTADREAFGIESYIITLKEEG